MIGTALKLAEKGLAVFPCAVAQKIPATAHGCLDATTDPEIIRQWWQSEPRYNLAIACGSISKIFVVDVDSDDAEAALRRLEAEHGELPPTIEVITGKGRHVYFRAPPASRVPNTAGRIAPGIDTRGEHGYVLAPPSRHPSGKRYCWSVDSAAAFAEAPQWLLAKITEPTNGNGSKPPAPPAEWRALLEAGAVEGCRDATVTRLAGYLLRHYVDPGVALSLLRSWNATHCAPPLPEADIVRVVNSISGKEFKRRYGHGG